MIALGERHIGAAGVCSAACMPESYRKVFENDMPVVLDQSPAAGVAAMSMELIHSTKSTDQTVSGDCKGAKHHGKLQIYKTSMAVKRAGAKCLQQLQAG